MEAIDRDTFTVFKPASVELIQKSDAKKGRRYIGGYASTDHLDRQGEVVFQKGLDFKEFVNHGYFNDNHNQKTAAQLGVPERVKYVIGKGWHTEGYLLNTKAADEVYELAKSLADLEADRKLGFSIEGKITERDGNKIKKAIIRNVAITSCPVNVNCTWELLSKAFDGGVTQDDRELVKGLNDITFFKSLAAGTGPGVRTASTGGRVLVGEDLEKDEVTHIYKCPKCKKGFKSDEGLDGHLSKAHGPRITTFSPDEVGLTYTRAKKGLTAQEAIALVKSRHPEWSDLACAKVAKFALVKIIKEGR